MRPAYDAATLALEFRRIQRAIPYVEKIDARDFGTLGVGSDDTAIINAALTAAQRNGGGVVIADAPNMRVDGQVQITADDTTLMLRGAIRRTVAPGATGMFEILGSATATATTLSVAGLEGDTTLTVVSSAGFAAGDVVLITSDQAVGGVAPYRDLQEVASVSAGSLTLRGALRHPFALGGNTVTVTAVTPVRNSHIIGPATLQHNVATDAGNLIRVLYGIECSVQGFTGYDHRSAAFLLRDSVACHFADLHPHDSLDPSGDGYGVQLFGSHDSTVSDCHGRNNRHSFDVARGSTGNVVTGCTAEGDASDAFVMGHGQVGRRNRAIGCRAYNATSVGFLFGNAAYGGDFDSSALDCVAVGSGSYGFCARNGATDITWEDCHAINGRAVGMRTETSAERVRVISPVARGNTTSEIVVATTSGFVEIVTPNVYKTTAGIAIEIVAAGASVCGGWVRGNGTPSTGIRQNGVSDARVEGVYIDNFANRGVQSSNGNGLTVTGCVIRNVPTGVETTGTSDKAIVTNNNLIGLTTPYSLTGSNNYVENNSDVSNVDLGQYAPGTTTVPTGQFLLMADHLELAGSESLTLQGTSCLVIV